MVAIVVSLSCRLRQGDVFLHFQGVARQIRLQVEL